MYSDVGGYPMGEGGDDNNEIPKGATGSTS